MAIGVTDPESDQITEAIRVSVGTPEEIELFAVALGHVLSGVS